MDEDLDCDQIGEENQDYGYELGMEDADDEAERLQAEETVLNNHLECVKQEAYLITVEGEIITKLENAMMNDEHYDMGAYLEQAEEIARKKLAMYSELLDNIGNFKSDFMNPQKNHHLQGGADRVNIPKEFIKLPNAKQNMRH